MRKITISIKHIRGKKYTENITNKKASKTKGKLLLEKSKNIALLRVIYKKPGQEPEIKIITNLFKLKKAIVEYDLEIILFQNVYIICHNKEQRKDMKLNIILDFCSIAGDIIVVQIDRRTREFKSLSQENIIWFTEVLNRRSPENIYNSTTYSQTYNNTYNKNICTTLGVTNYTMQNNNSKKDNNNNFQEKLLDALTNINLTLTYLVMNNKEWGGKNALYRQWTWIILYNPSEIFSCTYAPYFYEGIKIRYPEYTRETTNTKNNHIENIKER